MCIAKEEAEDLLHGKVIVPYFMFFCISLYISFYGATTNCRPLRNAKFVSADFLIIFHDEMNHLTFYNIKSPDRSNSHSSDHFIQYLHFLSQRYHFSFDP